MADGLGVPLRTFRGKAMIATGDKQMGKLIALSMSDGESSNPFLDAGLNAPIFDLNSPATRALVRRRIEQHFARFEADTRARLDTIEVSSHGAELSVRVRYVDLETDSVEEATKTITKG